MALSIKELQIGDWVTFGDEPLKVQHIYNNGYDDVVAETMEEFLDEDGTICEEIKDVPLVNCSPIPLTPEILEKNGWYFGLTSDEEDAEYCLGGCHYNRHWTYDEGAGSISLIFPNDADGGELIIDDQSFNRHLNLVFCDTLHVHELQRTLRLCGLNELADNFKI